MIKVGILDENLIGFWKFDEGSGSTAEDDSDNRNDGSITGATYVDGPFATALDFDGVDDKVTISDVAEIQNAFDGGGAVGAIINPDSDGENDTGRIISKGVWHLEVREESSGAVKIRFQYNFSTTNGIWTTSSTEVDINSNSPVIVNYNADSDTSDPEIYINGTKVSITETQTPSGTRADDSGNDLILGNDSAQNNSFDGVLDDLRLYSDTKTSAEITLLNKQGAGVQTPIHQDIRFDGGRATKLENEMENVIDTFKFEILFTDTKSYKPKFFDEVRLYHSEEHVFTGKISDIKEDPFGRTDTMRYRVKALNTSIELQKTIFSANFSNKTDGEIVTSIINDKAPEGFTADNVSGNKDVEFISFNQVTITDALQRLSRLYNKHFYVDKKKDVHYFSKFTEGAPFDLNRSNNQYIKSSLKKTTDGSQLANEVVVRGGKTETSTYTDTITVSGSNSKSFNITFKMSNLTVELDTGGGFVTQDKGLEGIDDFKANGGTADYLYNYQTRTIRFNSTLSDGDKIKFSGNRKLDVRSIAVDGPSIDKYGRQTKIIEEKGIESNDVARDRAQAELDAYSEPVEEIKFETETAGLRAGQTINYTDNNRGINEEFIIKQVVFEAYKPTDFEYRVTAVTTQKIELIEVLQGLLKPEPRISNDKSEIEDLKIVPDPITIEEVVTNVTPQKAEEDITVGEDPHHDPLGEDTEPLFVLAPSIPRDPDLLFRHDMDEGSGSSISDRSDNENAGTITGAVFKPGIYGTGLQFDSTDDKVEISDDATIQNIFDGGATIFAAIKASSDGENNSGRIYDKKEWSVQITGESSGNAKIRIQRNFSTTNGIWETTNLDITIGQFDTVAIKYDSSSDTNSPTILINGSSVSITEVQAPSGTRTDDTGNKLIIGNDVGQNNTFDGIIDETRSYSRLLTGSEITELDNEPGLATLEPEKDNKRVGLLSNSFKVY